MSISSYYFYYFISIYTGFPVVIRVAVILVMLLFFLSITSFIRFILIINKQKRLEKRKAKIERSYYEVFKNILYFTFQDVNEEYFREELRLKRPKKRWQKEMTTDLILRLKTDQSLEQEGGVFINHNYVTLMRYMQLIVYWENQMTTGDANAVIKALRILNIMGEGISGSVISQSVYSRKSYLRKYARSTFARFDIHDPFKFLEKGFDKDFNKFDEIRIHYILSEILKERQLPELGRWIKNAKADEYKRFLTKEIGYFGQIESAPFLVELFHDTLNEALKCQIAQSLGELQYLPAIDIYKEEFKFASQDLQLSILLGLSYFDSQIALPFLQDAYQYTQFSEAKIKIVTLIREFEQEGTHVLAELSKNAHSDFERKIFAYGVN